MSDVAQQIFERIVRRLQMIDTLTGFQNRLCVFKEEQQPASPRDRDVVVLDGDPIQQTNGPSMFDEYHLPIGIVGYAIEPEDSKVTLGERLRSIAADVRKALGDDLLGEDRIYVNLLWPEKDQLFSEGSPASVLLMPHFQYRTLRGNPNKQS